MMLTQDFLVNPNVKDCCKQEQNLRASQVTPDLSVLRCEVCGCRHFELSVDPLRMKLREA